MMLYSELIAASDYMNGERRKLKNFEVRRGVY